MRLFYGEMISLLISHISFISIISSVGTRLKSGAYPKNGIRDSGSGPRVGPEIRDPSHMWDLRPGTLYVIPEIWDPLNIHGTRDPEF